MTVARLAVVVAILASGSSCGLGPSPRPSPPSATVPSGSPVSTAPGPPASSPIAVDPELLDFVPASVDGVALEFDPATSAAIAADPSLARDVAAIAVALAVVPGASAADDLAIASVVRLRDPSKDDKWFRDWRDTYDTGACGQAGGVVGNAQAEMGGRTVFIGSCEGGVRTYHARLDDAGIVVSITALGPRRLGEKLMAEIE